MAFTTPATAVAGTVLTAAFLNTYLRDNIAWLATDSPCCRVYNNANISITTSGTWQSLTFNSERFDNAAMHSTSSNTDRITIPSGGGGKYLLWGGAEFAGNATGARGTRFRQNATTVISLEFRYYTPIDASNTVDINNTAPYSLAAADYATFEVVQTSGGALNAIVQANSSPEAAAFWFRT